MKFVCLFFSQKEGGEFFPNFSRTEGGGDEVARHKRGDSSKISSLFQSCYLIHSVKVSVKQCNATLSNRVQNTSV